MKTAKIIIFITMIGLCSCGHKPLPIPCPVVRVPITIQSPAPLELNDVKWHVLTEKNYQTEIENLKSQGHDPVFYALDSENLKNLNVDLALIHGYIKKQREMIDFSNEYYKTTLQSDTPSVKDEKATKPKGLLKFFSKKPSEKTSNK